MIYAVTQRPSWSTPRTGGKFLFTTLVAASITASIVNHRLWPLAMLCVVLKLLVETAATWHSIDQHGRVSDFFSPLSQTARLIRGPLSLFHSLRIVVGIGSLLAMGVTAALTQNQSNSTAMVSAIVVTVALVVVGEILERTLFFASCVAPKMPGGLST
jgi:DMSO reductase anchor subunit